MSKGFGMNLVSLDRNEKTKSIIYQKQITSFHLCRIINSLSSLTFSTLIHIKRERWPKTFKDSMIKNLLRASYQNTPVIAPVIMSLINAKNLASYANLTLEKVVLTSVMHIAYHPSEQKPKPDKTKPFRIRIFMSKSLEILRDNQPLKIVVSLNQILMAQKGNYQLFQIHQALGT
jgi:hypothetical protein